MRGKVLSYKDLEGEGLISGDDGLRYPFLRGALQNGMRTIAPGTDIDFEAVDGKAANIYAVGGGAAGQVGDKNKIAAALLAFFLGWLGIHKFYLNKSGAGIIMLLCGTVGWILFAIPPLVIGIIAFIEFIIYLTKSDQQFYQDYVVGNRSWF